MNYIVTNIMENAIRVLSRVVNSIRVMPVSFIIILILCSYATPVDAQYKKSNTCDFPDPEVPPSLTPINDGSNDNCDTFESPLAQQLDVLQFALAVPVPGETKITFTINLNNNDLNTVPLKNWLAGYLYIDIDQKKNTGMPLGASTISCRNHGILWDIVGQRTFLGPDYVIDLGNNISTNPTEYHALIDSLVWDGNTNCTADTNKVIKNPTTREPFSAKVEVSGSNVLKITIEDFDKLDSRVTGFIDFVAVFGYPSYFGNPQAHPGNPVSYRPVEIVPDNLSENGRVGRNRDSWFIKPPEVAIAKSVQKLTFMTDNKNTSQDMDRFVTVDLNNGIPYSSYSVKLKATPNLFAAIDTSRRAVTERAFGFRMDLEPLGDDILQVSFTPKVTDSLIVTEAGNGPVGLIFFDHYSLEKFLETYGDSTINIQGFDVYVDSAGQDVSDRLKWSVYNNIKASDLEPPTVDNPDWLSPDDIRVVPNPFCVNIVTPARLRFVNLPGECTIKIFTERGDLIKVFRHTDDSYDEEWDLIAESGNMCAAGVYIAVFETPKGTSFEKFVIVR